MGVSSSAIKYDPKQRLLADEALFDVGWKNGKNKRVDNIVGQLKTDLSYIIDQGADFTMFLGTDSEKLTRNSKKRRYSSVIGLHDGTNSKIFTKSRIEPNNQPIKSRMQYELCGTLKLFQKLQNELYDLLIEANSGFELHADINTDRKYKSSRAYPTVQSILENKKRSENPFLIDVKFKPDAPYASKVGDRACRGKHF